jgi:lysophospholipase L1-like esterase
VRGSRASAKNPPARWADFTRRAAPGYTLVAMGDSITAGDGDVSAHIEANTWCTFMTLASQGAVRLVRNSGIGGQRSGAMLARFQADVLDYDPAAVIIATGTNDTDWSETLICVEQMIQMALSQGVAVGLITGPPGGSGPAASPSGLTATAGTGSGTLAAGTYDYAVCTETSGGASLRTNSATVTVSATGNVTLNWSRAHGEAYRYRIYRRTSGSGTYNLIGGIGAGYGRSDVYPYFVDTGLAENTAANPPTIDQSGTANFSGATMTTARRTQLIRIGQVMHQLAAKYGLPIADQYSLLVDTTTGTYQTGVSTDGTHPGSRTQRAMGANAWAQMKTLFPGSPPILARDPLNLTGLLSPQNALGGVSTNGALLPVNAALPAARQPQGWSLYSVTPQAVSTGPEAGTPGNVFSVTAAGYSAVLSDIVISSGFTVGDRVRVAFKVRTAGLDDNGGYVNVFVKPNTGPAVANLKLTADVTDFSIWTAEAVVSTGTTGLTVGMYVLGRGVTGSIAQITVDNMTAQGLV